MRPWRTGDRAVGRGQPVEQAVDPRVAVEAHEWESVRGAIKLGVLCTSKVPVDRPNMNEVYHLLNHLEDLGAIRQRRGRLSLDCTVLYSTVL